MPLIHDMRLNCKFFGIPYPMTRQGLSQLIEAIWRWHEPEGVHSVGIAWTTTCRVCRFYAGTKGVSECRADWKARPHPCITKDTPGAFRCPASELRPDVWLLMVDKKDLVMDDWAKKKKKEKEPCQENHSPDCSSTSGAGHP